MALRGAEYQAWLKALAERDQTIVELRKGGMPYKEIAKRYGITRTRAGQIVARQEWLKAGRPER